jgi:hypothetical protein
MAALNTSTLSDTGTAPTFVAAAASDTVEIGNGHNVFVVYKNAAGSPVTVTVLVPGNTFFGTATADNAISVPATNGEKWIPIRKDYDDGSGRATITTSSQTSVTVAVVKVS